MIQVRAGQQRSKAFNQRVPRPGLEDTKKSRAAMILRSERFGASFSPALKVCAGALRTRRPLRRGIGVL